MTALGNEEQQSNGTPTDPAALREEIKRTRAELGETVQLLAAKADVKARVKQSASQARERFRERAGATAARVREQAGNAQSGTPGASIRTNPVPLATAIGVAASAVAVILLVMRRRRR